MKIHIDLRLNTHNSPPGPRFAHRTVDLPTTPSVGDHIHLAEFDRLIPVNMVCWQLADGEVHLKIGGVGEGFAGVTREDVMAAPSSVGWTLECPRDLA